MVATKLPAAPQDSARVVENKPVKPTHAPGKTAEVAKVETKPQGWKPKEPSALDLQINRFQVYADRVSLVAYGAAILAEGGAIAAAAGSVAAPALLPVAATLGASSVVLNGVAGAIDIANAAIDGVQAADAAEGDAHIGENLKKAIDPSLTYMKKSAIGLFHRYVYGSVEQSAADFRDGYAAKDEALKHIEANPAFAAEFIPGVERAIGGGSALGLWFPKLGHVVMALEIPDMGVAYNWAKAWWFEGDLTKEQVDATFSKAFPKSKAAEEFSKAIGDPERFDAGTAQDLKTRVELAERSLRALDATSPNGDKAATEKALARAHEWVDELKDEFHARDPELNLRTAFAGNKNVDVLITATNDLERAWKLSPAELKKSIATADAALAQLKAVKFTPETQEANDKFLRVFLSKTDRMRDVLNSKTNAFLMLPRSMTPLR